MKLADKLLTGLAFLVGTAPHAFAQNDDNAVQAALDALDALPSQAQRDATEAAEYEKNLIQRAKMEIMSENMRVWTAEDSAARAKPAKAKAPEIHEVKIINDRPSEEELKAKRAAEEKAWADKQAADKKRLEDKIAELRKADNKEKDAKAAAEKKKYDDEQKRIAQEAKEAEKEREKELKLAREQRAKEEAAEKKQREEDERAAAEKKKADELAAKEKAEKELAAKKKADEEKAAAEKKKADEAKAAAEKKKADELAAKKKADEELAAKKKAEEEKKAQEFAAKKKADEEKAAKAAAIVVAPAVAVSYQDPSLDADLNDMRTAVLKMANNRLGGFINFRTELDKLNDSLNSAKGAVSKTDARLDADHKAELARKQAAKAADLKKLNSAAATVLDSANRLDKQAGAAANKINIAEIAAEYNMQSRVVADSADIIVKKSVSATERAWDKEIKAYTDSTDNVRKNSSSAGAKEVKRIEDNRNAAVRNFIIRSSINQRNK
jgi:hypothetical protein